MPDGTMKIIYAPQLGPGTLTPVQLASPKPNSTSSTPISLGTIPSLNKNPGSLTPAPILINAATTSSPSSPIILNSGSTNIIKSTAINASMPIILNTAKPAAVSIPSTAPIILTAAPTNINQTNTSIPIKLNTTSQFTGNKLPSTVPANLANIPKSVPIILKNNLSAKNSNNLSKSPTIVTKTPILNNFYKTQGKISLLRSSLLKNRDTSQISNNSKQSIVNNSSQISNTPSVVNIDLTEDDLDDANLSNNPCSNNNEEVILLTNQEKLEDITSKKSDDNKDSTSEKSDDNKDTTSEKSDDSNKQTSQKLSLPLSSEAEEAETSVPPSVPSTSKELTYEFLAKNPIPRKKSKCKNDENNTENSSSQVSPVSATDVLPAIEMS